MKVKIQELKLLPEAKPVHQAWKRLQLNNFIKHNQKLLEIYAHSICVPVMCTNEDYFIFSNFWVSFCDRSIRIKINPVRLTPNEAEINSWVWFFLQNPLLTEPERFRSTINSVVDRKVLRRLFGKSKLTRELCAHLLGCRVSSLRWHESKAKQSQSTDDSVVSPIAKILLEGQSRD